MMKDQTQVCTEIKRELEVLGMTWEGFRAKESSMYKNGYTYIERLGGKDYTGPVYVRMQKA